MKKIINYILKGIMICLLAFVSVKGMANIYNEESDEMKEFAVDKLIEFGDYADEKLDEALIIVDEKVAAVFND